MDHNAAQPNAASYSINLHIPLDVLSNKALQTAIEIPSESEARRLLKVVVFYIGQTQHHFDPRDFSDRLGSFYVNPQDPSHYATPWYLEMLLVFAIAKLFAGEFGGDSTELPGAHLFEFAQNRLPTLSELYNQPRLGIELLALLAVYLQNVNRKEEAYVYVSIHSARLPLMHPRTSI